MNKYASMVYKLFDLAEFHQILIIMRRCGLAKYQGLHSMVFTAINCRDKNKLRAPELLSQLRFVRNIYQG